MPESQRSSWTDEYEIHSYETGAGGEVSLAAVCRFFQESAWHHARSVKQWYDDLLARGCFWVLSRLTLRMSRFPLWGERIRVKTWSCGTDRLFAIRDFLVHDEKNTLVGSARSAWLVVSDKTRKPRRIDAFFEGAPVTVPVPAPVASDPCAFEGLPEKIPALVKPRSGQSFPVRYSDLDMQNHVNNARYVEWCLDSFPPELHASHRPRLFSINFLAECAYGDVVTIRTERVPAGPPVEAAPGTPGGETAQSARNPRDAGTGSDCAPLDIESLVSMSKNSDDKELCRARIVWR